jgi:hypothetical protein
MCHYCIINDMHWRVRAGFSLLPAGIPGRAVLTPGMHSIAQNPLSHRDDILALAQKHGAFNVRIFGSMARGEATSESDIDFPEGVISK